MHPYRLKLYPPRSNGAPSIHDLLCRRGKGVDRPRIVNLSARLNHATLTFAGTEAVVLRWWLVDRGFLVGTDYELTYRPVGSPAAGDARQLLLFSDCD